VRSALEAMSSKDIAFNINFEKDKGIRTDLQLPPKQEISRFAAVIRPMADPEGHSNYKDIAALLFENGFINSENKDQFDKKVRSIESGPVRLKINEKNLSALDLYVMYSKGEFFSQIEDEANKIKEFQQNPFLAKQIVFTFYSFCFDTYKLCESLYDVIRDAEKSRSINESNKPEFQHCIYCLTKAGSFEFEEHVYPESLGNTEIILPPGHVCDNCNNGVLSKLDQHLVEHDIISFLRTWVLPYNPKTGKFPKARYQNVSVEKISPRELLITRHNPKMGLDMEENGEQSKGKLTMQGRMRFDPLLLGRALYKIALGIVCTKNGMPMALDKRYDAARHFVLGKQSFPNNLFMKRECIPCGHIEGEHHILDPGTFFKISIFGIAFGFNLEPEPFLEMIDELDEMGIQCFSLSE